MFDEAHKDEMAEDSPSAITLTLVPGCCNALRKNMDKQDIQKKLGKPHNTKQLSKTFAVVDGPPAVWA